MQKNMNKILGVAVIAGLLHAKTVLADDTAKAAATDGAKAEKNSCKCDDKDSCKGEKNSCKCKHHHKHMKKEASQDKDGCGKDGCGGPGDKAAKDTPKDTTAKDAKPADAPKADAAH